MTLTQRKDTQTEGTYRGYYIYPDLCKTTWFIRKGDAVIGQAASFDAAKRVVDAVHGD